METFQMNPSQGLEFGIYTLGDHLMNPETGTRLSAKERLNQIVELAKLADDAGLDFFSVGENHQDFFVTQAHTVVLSAIAQATKRIKVGSSATILSTSDPVRVYEDFATIDLLSGGRAEIIAGRASRVGLFDLLGYDLNDYEGLNEGMKRTNGQGFPKQAFALGKDKNNVMNIGSVEEVTEKILYQHDVFKHQRYIGQMDFGGVPFKQLMKNIEYLGEKILPKVKKYTKEES